jgi:hypothetical protein
MYLVGARFEELGAAEAALLELRERVEVDDGDVGLQSLGSLRYEQPAEGLVVAGRFRRGDVEGVVEILHRYGGEIVFNRAEWRIPRPPPTASDRGSGRCSWFSRLRR